MKSLRDSGSRIPFYPFLLGVYSVLFLWQENFTQVPAFALPRSLLFATCVSATVYLAGWLLVRNLRRSSALTGLFLLLFFFYGHFYNLVQTSSIQAFAGVQHRHVLLLWGALFVFGATLILRGKSDMLALTWICNQGSVFLLAISLGTLGALAVGQSSAPKQTPTAEPTGKTIETPDRDVYYILVDSYPREDWLKEYVDLDNHEFVSGLEGLGFVVPDCTQANYDNTVFSMTATLNLNYLDRLGFSYAEMAASPGENGYKAMLTPTLHDNSVMRLFRDAGYKILTFETPYPFVDFRESDVVYDEEANTNILDKLESLTLQYWLMRTSLMMPIVERLQPRPELLDRLPSIVLQLVDPRDGQNATRKYKQYLQNVFALQSLEAIPQLPGKKFIYAHLLLTYPPFTFNPDGSYAVGSSSFEQAFRDQIAFANRRLSQVVETIVSQSRQAPVIVIQGDHAVFYGDAPRFRILNAYFLPGVEKDQLSPSMTPVNTFRLIFSTYLGLDYPLLNDQSILIDRSVQDGYRMMPGGCAH